MIHTARFSELMERYTDRTIKKELYKILGENKDGNLTIRYVKPSIYKKPSLYVRMVRWFYRFIPHTHIFVYSSICCTCGLSRKQKEPNV